MSFCLRLSTLLLLMFLSYCSVLSSVRSPSSSYLSYVDERVEEARLFDRGKELLSLKAMMANETLLKKQEELTPGFHFPYLADKDQVILALDFSTWERFSTDDVKIFLEGMPAKKVLEITNPTLIEMHYSFAHPHYRVFCVSFEKMSLKDEVELQVQTLRGELKLKLSNK